MTPTPERIAELSASLLRSAEMLGHDVFVPKYLAEYLTSIGITEGYKVPEPLPVTGGREIGLVAVDEMDWLGALNVQIKLPSRDLMDTAFSAYNLTHFPENYRPVRFHQQAHRGHITSARWRRK